MKVKLLLLLSLLLLSNIFIYGQNSSQGTVITGKVIETDTNTPMEFANVVIFSLPDSVQVTGTVTDSKGIFELTGIKKGNYFVEVSFIGFTEQTIDNLQVTGSGTINLDQVSLAPRTYGTEDIVVEGQRSPISYQIDKKVIDVSQQLTSLSGSAVDILENVPSVTVDIEGNVELRGSTSFTVLIDGRPTVMEASDALQQIPASSIENIEIITNPSAKYDPEGTAGIINIILKKSQRAGMSGVLEANGGTQDNYGGEGLFDYRSEGWQANISANGNNRNFNGKERESDWTKEDGYTSYITSDGTSKRGRDSYGVKASFAFDLSKNDFIQLGGRYSHRTFGGNGMLNYNEWTSLDTEKNNYLNYTDSERKGDNYNAFGTFTHDFNENGHKVIVDLNYGWEDTDELTINKLISGDVITEGQKTTESGPETEFEGKVDYTLPINADSKFEAGYAGEMENSKENTGLYDYDTALGDYVELEEYDNHAEYDKDQHAFYAMYSNKLGTLGYQVGFRTEYTGRTIKITNKNEEFKIDRWDYFPSAHFSYAFLKDNQVMASYTRRINRPRGWQLEPFETWTDAYTVREGNPALKPEYIDSYELGLQTLIKDIVFSVEGYYRFTDNKIERVRSVYSENVTLHSFENVGTDYSVGTELFFNFAPLTPWDVNLMGDLYNYKIKGTMSGEAYEKTSFNWNVRFNNTFKLLATTQLQFNLRYNSPSVSSQGTREDFLYADVAVKQDLFHKMLSATLQIRDIFGTAEFKETYESADFYNYAYRGMESPMVMLNLRFNFNNYKSQEKPQNTQGGEMLQSEGDEF